MKTSTVSALSREECAAALRFLKDVRYGDVYGHMPSCGDGNRAGSASDVETRETLSALHKLCAIVEEAGR